MISIAVPSVRRKGFNEYGATAESQFRSHEPPFLKSKSQEAIYPSVVAKIKITERPAIRSSISLVNTFPDHALHDPTTAVTIEDFKAHCLTFIVLPDYWKH